MQQNEWRHAAWRPHFSIKHSCCFSAHTPVFFCINKTALHAHLLLCKPALASLYSPSLAQGHLGELFGLLFLCLHIHPTFPPNPAAPKHRPSLGCVALPRLSHQAPLNLTCFSHFLHQRESERETETHSGVGRLCPREVKLKQLHWTDTRPCTKQQEPVLTHPPTAPLLSAPAAVVTGRCLVRSSNISSAPRRLAAGIWSLPPSARCNATQASASREPRCS